MKIIRKILMVLVVLSVFTSCGYYKGIILFSTRDEALKTETGEVKTYTFSNGYKSFYPGESKYFVVSNLSYAIDREKSEEEWWIRLRYKNKKINMESIKIEAINSKGELVPIFADDRKLEKKEQSFKIPEGWLRMFKSDGFYYWDLNIKSKKIDLNDYGQKDSPNRSYTLIKFTIKVEGKPDNIIYQPFRLPVETPYSQRAIPREDKK